MQSSVYECMVPNKTDQFDTKLPYLYAIVIIKTLPNSYVCLPFYLNWYRNKENIYWFPYVFDIIIECDIGVAFGITYIPKSIDLVSSFDGYHI